MKVMGRAATATLLGLAMALSAVGASAAAASTVPRHAAVAKSAEHKPTVTAKGHTEGRAAQESEAGRKGGSGPIVYGCASKWWNTAFNGLCNYPFVEADGYFQVVAKCAFGAEQYADWVKKFKGDKGYLYTEPNGQQNNECANGPIQKASVNFKP